jgi:hypothetical protein
MFDFWKSELTEEETEELLDRAAHAIRKRRMQAPAILMLESHRPLCNVGGHAALVFAPFIIPFLGFDRVNNYSMLLSKQENIERLVQRLEAPVKEGDAKC